jgi:hypothetical protein
VHRLAREGAWWVCGGCPPEAGKLGNAADKELLVLAADRRALWLSKAAKKKFSARGMGKGRDQKGGRGGAKQFSAPEDLRKQKAPEMPPSDSEEEESEEEDEQVRGGQSANAGMMPPSSSEEEEESDDDDPPPTASEMAAFIKSKGLADEFMKWRKTRSQAASSKAKAPPGYEKSKAEQKKQAEEEEEEEEEEVDPKVAARLEEVRKRREAQSKQRIAADGWDRMKPMSADNHPPGMGWPPPDQEEKPAEVS